MRVLITGGSEGLGLSLAKQSIEKGWTTHICGRNAEKLEKAKREINSDLLITHVCDVSSIEKVRSMISEIPEIDVLINNAGVWLEGDVENNSDESIKNVIDVNLTGLVYVTKYCLKKLQSSETPYIINISSTSGLTARADQAVYAASKWGVRGFTEALRERFKSSKVKVVGVYPGGMSTELFSSAGFGKDVSNWMSTDEVAKSIFTIFDQPANMVTANIEFNKKV